MAGGAEHAVVDPLDHTFDRPSPGDDALVKKLRGAHRGAVRIARKLRSRVAELEDEARQGYERGWEDGQRKLLREARAVRLTRGMGYTPRLGHLFVQDTDEEPTEEAIARFAGELGIEPGAGEAESPAGGQEGSPDA